jgi:Peptidase family M23
MMRPSSFFCTLLAASLLLAACGSGIPPTASPPQPASPSPDLPSPTKALIPVPTPSRTPTITPVPCDVSAGFCVEKGKFILQRPIAPPGNEVIDRNYPYGSTEEGTREVHHGVEFENPSGTPVLAAADGTVYYAGNDATRKFSPWANFYGNIVVIEHSISDAPFNKLYTLYAHLSKIDVSLGQAVQSGEAIGEVGMTGTAAGSHLHFELRVTPDDYNSTLDPELWLLPRSGNGTLAILAADPSGASVFPSFRIQYFPDRNKPATASYMADGYARETVNPRDPWKEVAAIGDQPAGWYRITFQWDYVPHERWVEIQPGMLTRVRFVVK